MKTISLVDVEALALVFDAGKPHTYVVCDEPDTLKFWERFGHDAKRIPVDSAHVSDYGKGYFAFWVEDCFDPSVAIVRADSFEDAYETFCDEFSDWLKIDESDLPDYTDEETDEYTGNYSASGVAIDTEAVNGRELTLLRVIVAE
jgi:hypothetical protein